MNVASLISRLVHSHESIDHRNLNFTTRAFGQTATTSQSGGFLSSANSITYVSDEGWETLMHEKRSTTTK